MPKRIICVILTLILVFSLAACNFEFIRNGTDDPKLTVEEMTASLENLASELQKSVQKSNPDMKIKFVVNSDGSCVMRSVDGNTETDMYSDKSVKAMFKAYRDAGMLSETGEVLGLGEATYVDDNKLSPEEILEDTEIQGANEEIAGFPETDSDGKD